MSNDPLLGLDSVELIEEQQQDSKWTKVPKKRSGGHAVRTRPGIFGPEEEWRPGIWVSAAPELKAEPATAVESKCWCSSSKPCPEGACPYDRPADLPRVFAVKKPSRLQRLLDWLLL